VTEPYATVSSSSSRQEPGTNIAFSQPLAVSGGEPSVVLLCQYSCHGAKHMPVESLIAYAACS
jgi:hypothetical protein